MQLVICESPTIYMKVVTTLDPLLDLVQDTQAIDGLLASVACLWADQAVSMYWLHPPDQSNVPAAYSNLPQAVM